MGLMQKIFRPHEDQMMALLREVLSVARQQAEVTYLMQQVIQQQYDAFHVSSPPEIRKNEVEDELMREYIQRLEKEEA